MAWQQYLRKSLDDIEVYDLPPATEDIRLHANESPLPWSEEIMQRIATRIQATELNRYPDTSARGLRKILAERHDCDPNNIVLGNGSDEIISLLLTALSGGEKPGAMVIPTPTFVMYRIQAKVADLEIREVPLRPEDFQLDLPRMEAALEGAAICFLARPNNPTSSLWEKETIESLIRNHPDTIFVIDEAYGPYAPGESLWRGDLPDHVVYMSTLSKIGFAGLRLGYSIACPELSLALNRVRHPYNISLTNITIAETILKEFPEQLDAMLKENIANRGRLVDILKGLPNVEVYPAHANFVMLKVHSPEVAKRFTASLKKRSILIKNLSGQPGLASHLRVSIGSPRELDRLEELLSQMQAHELP